jgi:hypothetical protein
MRAKDDFNPSQAAKRLLREAGKGALATLLPGGAPYASLVTVATAFDGAPILLLSRLARHTANITGDPRASLLLETGAERDPLEGGRVSLSGTLARTEDPAARRRFLARHPEAEAYAGFGDFGFWRMDLTGAHLVAGFGRIADVKRDDLLTTVADARSLAEVEEDAIAHMNDDHRGSVALFATRLLGDEPGDWRLAAIDPEGCDLMLDERTRRLDFPQRVTDGDVLRRVLIKLTEEAKARA